jgi:hypothetical protein
LPVGWVPVMGRSSAGERLLCKQGVIGSIPIASMWKREIRRRLRVLGGIPENPILDPLRGPG